MTGRSTEATVPESSPADPGGPQPHPDSSDTRAASVLAAFGYRDFRLFWFGNSVSNVGIWMETLGLGWLVVELAARDGRPDLAPMYLGLAGLGRAAPALGLSFFAGAIVDRTDRRNVLIATQAAACVVSLVLAILVVTNSAGLAAIIPLVVMRSLIFAFEAPARQSLVAQIVPRHHLMSAIGLNQASFNGPHAIGPAIGGVLIAIGGGVGPLFFANAASYVVVIVALAYTAPRPILQPHRPPVAAVVVEGIRYMRQDPVIKWTITLAATFAFFAEPYVFLVPAFAANVLSVGATELSWILAATGVGALLGSIVVATLGTIRRRGALQLATMAATAISIIVMMLQRELWLVLIGAVLVGVTTIVCNGVTNTILQTAAPQRMLGRVMSIYTMIFMAFMPLGQLAIGALGSAVGVDRAILAGGAVTLVASIYAYARLPVIRDLTA